MKQGILYLVESRRPPVFRTPMVITYSQEPKLDEAFIFHAVNGPSYCNLSVTQKLVEVDGYKRIKTLNSEYILYPLPKDTI